MPYSRSGNRIEAKSMPEMKYSPDQARDGSGKVTSGKIQHTIKPPFKGDKISAHLSHDAALSKASSIQASMNMSGENQTHDLVIHSAPQTVIQDGQPSNQTVHTIYKVPKK